MKKLFFLLFLIFCFSGNSFANFGVSGNRIQYTTTTYGPGTSTLIRRGNAEVRAVTFTATANNGSFYILDAITDTTNPGGAGNFTDVKIEGSSSVSGNSYQTSYNFPFQISTGLYVVVTNGYLNITYD